MELETRSPYPGDTGSHRIATRSHKNHSTPCEHDGQVYIKLVVDGQELSEYKLSQYGWKRMQQEFPEIRGFWHEVAELMLVAASTDQKRLLPPQMPAGGLSSLL